MIVDETPGSSDQSVLRLLELQLIHQGKDLHSRFYQFSEEWLKVLDKDDKRYLAISLCYYLMSHFNLKNTKAAQVAPQMVNKSDPTEAVANRPR